MTKHAYSYIRFSTKRQMKGNSLRRQTERAQQLCEKYGWTLDPLSYKDLGMSGYHLANARVGDLSLFLEAINLGKVKSGSILIVENLDRLTRADIVPAMEIFMAILTRGVGIATFDPERVYTADDINKSPMLLFEPILIMVRGNEESSRKEGLARNHWHRRIKNAMNEIITSNMPGWLEAVDGKFKVIPSRVRTVKYVFRLAVEMGIVALTKHLNDRLDEHPPVTGKSHWDDETIRRLLRSRKVLGEFQAFSRDGGRRVPVGQPIVGYYPQIISESGWCRVQQAMDSRMNHGGRVGHRVANLFSGLVTYGNGERAVLRSANLPSDPTQRNLIPASAYRTTGNTVVFSYRIFEDCVLNALSELNKEDILPPQEKEDNALETAEGRLADIDYRLATIKKRLRTEPDLDTLMDMVGELQREKKEVVKDVERRRAETHDGGVLESWNDAKKLTAELKELTGDELTAARRRLKARVAQLVKAIVIKVERVNARARKMTGNMLLASGVERGFLISYDSKGYRYAILDDLQNLRAGKRPSRIRIHQEKQPATCPKCGKKGMKWRSEPGVLTRECQHCGYSEPAKVTK